MAKKSYVLYGSLMLILCGIARSTDLFFRIPTIEKLPVPVIIFWEHFITSIFLLPLVFKYKGQFIKVPIRDWILFFMIGAGASALGILFFTKAFGYLNPALVILLQKLQPVVTVVLGFVFLKEKVSKGFVKWAVLAIISSYFVSFSLTNPFTGQWKQLGIGVVYTLLAVFFWGSGTVWGKMLLNNYENNFVLLNRFLIGTAFSFFLSLYFYNNMGINIFDRQLALNLAYMAIIPGLIATGFFYHGLNRVKASIASMLELVFPLSSVLIMWFFFNRPLDNVQLFASLILIFSITKITVKE
jgi:drug/metabolite transporter (DMT)-like permease